MRRSHTRIIRARDWYDPPVPVRREVLFRPPVDTGRPRPPLLFVHGLSHGAWCFAEHWLEYAADRGYPAHAMSLRGHGDSGGADLRRRTRLRDYVHDVVQVASGLSRQAVLVGAGLGGLVVAGALARYPARAGVLVAPVFNGWSSAFAAFASHPAGVLPALVGGRLRLSARQLFSAELPADAAKMYLERLGPQAPAVRLQTVFHRAPEPPLAGARVLVAGSPDDRLVPQRALARVARRYGGEPLLFPGMGHDLMLDARWVEPIDAILGWLDKQLG